MNDDEVRKQLAQMVSFIEKEAQEKASEISVRAQEEFNIEKQKLVKIQKDKIRKEFAKKEDAVELKKKITYSNELNQSRLSVLSAREQAVKEVYQTAAAQLPAVSSSPNYPQLLQKLITQGLIKVEEKDCEIIVRQVDLGIAQNQLASAISEVKRITGRDCNAKISQKHFLAPPARGGQSADSAHCSGGCLISVVNGNLLCNNTLEQRLALAYQALLPNIRISLFGASTTRTHLD